MKTKYIITVNQDSNVDHSEDIKEDLEYGITNGYFNVESVEIVGEKSVNFWALERSDWKKTELSSKNIKSIYHENR